MQREHVFAVLASAVLFTGCFVSRGSINTPLHRGLLAELSPGTTTAREVTDRLGAPNEVVQLGARTAYRYDFTSTKRAGFSVIVVTLLNEDTRSDRVWLFFDANDVLTHAGATFEGRDAEYAMPWQRLRAH